jgi:hypothetical protein
MELVGRVAAHTGSNPSNPSKTATATTTAKRPEGAT